VVAWSCLLYIAAVLAGGTLVCCRQDSRINVARPLTVA
jgi:hypothetical protein